MKQASIDIGTNSVLLLVAEVLNNKINVLHEKQQIPRLGKGVDKDRKLHPQSMNRVLEVLSGYKGWLQSEHPEICGRVIVTATSAVRDAANRDHFLGRVKNETGWNVKLLSGREEAETTFKGALSVLESRQQSNHLILDIGGGSTEIAAGFGLSLQQAFSVDMGSVRFTERFFRTDPPQPSGIEMLRQTAKDLLTVHPLPFEDFDAIGVAGTVTSVAAIKKGLRHYDASALNGFRMKRQDVQAFIQEFSVTASEKTEEKYAPFLTGRGDVILAGMIILDEFLAWSKKEKIIISTGGIRHGILLQ